MQQLLYILPALVCPVAMGAVMWLMMRPGAKHPQHTAATPDPEIAALRAEMADLRATQQPTADRHTPIPLGKTGVAQ